jgi:UDP-N-acetylmuramoylalanine--D-glutamate ligase
LKIHHEPLRTVLEKCRSNGAEIIGEMELAARFCPAPIIAVTGTKGKSTTVKLLTELLRACGEHAISCGNTGSPFMAALPQLTPASWVVLEVSSFQLETVSTLKPRVAILLNLLEDHQDYHPTLEQYWETKMRLFAHQDKDDFAVLNSDEKRVLEYAAQLPKEVKVLLASANKCEKCVVQMQDGKLGLSYRSTFEPVISIDEIPLAGAHNHANVAAALTALFAALGEKVLLQTDIITTAIKNFSSLPHRLEIVAANGVTWINDSQATIPDASAAALKAFAAPRLLIAGGRAKLEISAYKNWANEVASRAEYLITIGEAQEMFGGLAHEAGMPSEKIIAAGDLKTAVEIAAKFATPGSTVIFSPACASFDQFKSYEDRGNQFRHLASQVIRNS